MAKPFMSLKVRWRKVLGFSILCVLGLLNPLNLEPDFAQTNFYQGKSLTIIVGTKTGDVYDLYPRLLAEYLSKYIPGRSNIISQWVPATSIAANHVRGVATTAPIRGMTSTGDYILHLRKETKEAVTAATEVVERMKKVLGM